MDGPSDKRVRFFIVDACMKICMGWRYEARWQNCLVDGWMAPPKKGSGFYSVDAYMKISMGWRYEAKWQNGLVEGPSKKGSVFFLWTST